MGQCIWLGGGSNDDKVRQRKSVGTGFPAAGSLDVSLEMHSVSSL